MKKVLALMVVCLLLVGGMLAGCQQADEPTKTAAPVKETNNEVEETQAPVVEEEGTYKLGVAAPITGNWAEYGKGFEVATAMAVEKINADGGVNGKMLELEVMDSKGDAKEATEIARKFSEDEDVLGVVGDFSSTCCMATAPIYEEAGMVQLSPTASHPDYAGMSEYMFGIMGRQDGEGPFVAEFLAQKFLETEKMGIIYLNNDWGLTAHQNILKKADEIGVEVTALENFVDGEKDFTATLTKIRETNPDTLCLVMFYNELVIISKQIKQMGWDVKICALGPGVSQQIIDLGGEDVEGIVTSTPFMVSEDNKEVYDFAQEFESRAGFTLNVHSACAYDAVFLLANAIENCDEVTRENIAVELAATEGFSGMTGPIKFSEAGDVTRKYLVAKIVDGQWTQMTDYDFAN